MLITFNVRNNVDIPRLPDGNDQIAIQPLNWTGDEILYDAHEWRSSSNERCPKTFLYRHESLEWDDGPRWPVRGYTADCEWSNFQERLVYPLAKSVEK